MAQFDTASEIVEYFNGLISELHYPSSEERPVKPVKNKNESNQEFGRRMDVYEIEKVDFVEKQKAYREKSNEINKIRKEEILKFFNCENDERAQKLWDKVYNEYHSGGYMEVVNFFEEYLEIVNL